MANTTNTIKLPVWLNLNVSLGRVSLVQKAVLAKNLAVMLKSGISIVEALEVSQDAAEGRLKKVLKQVRASVQSGRPLAEALQDQTKHFSDLFISAVRAGEASGTLEDNLEQVADELEKERELIAKVKGAMTYPVVVLVAAFVLGLAMAFVVLPKITPIFRGLKVDLPLTTRALMSFAAAVESHGLLIFLGIIFCVAFVIWLVKRSFVRPLTHWLILRLPIIGLLSRQLNLARQCRMLGTMIKSGIRIDEALDILAKATSNYYYRRALLQINEEIRTGQTLAQCVSRRPKLYPLLVVKMVLVGEESGQLDETLQYLSRFYERNADNATKTLATAIEPILLLCIGGVVLFLALSIITPIYQITGNLRG